jgi:putative peptidoglycan lipid II flippase
VTISSFYGTSPIADAFFGIQQVTLIVSSFMFGAFTLAYVPHLAASRSGGCLRDLTKPVSVAALAIGAAVSILMAAVGILVGQYVGTFLVILSLAVVPIVVSGLSFADLVSQGRQVHATLIAASAPAAMLFVFLGGLVVLPNRDLLLPASFVAGWLVAAALGLRTLLGALSMGIDRSQPRVSDNPVRRFVRDLGASGVENVGFSLNQAATTFAAAAAGAGAIAVNAYASRIAMFALSGLIAPLQQIAGGRFAQQAATSARPARSQLAPICLLAIAVAVLIGAGGPTIAQVVYGRGAFGADDVARVGAALLPYAAYFGVMATNQTFARYLFAVGAGKKYAICMVGAYAVEVVLKVIVAPLGLVAVIWTSVACEGTALIALSLVIVRNRD